MVMTSGLGSRSSIVARSRRTAVSAPARRRGAATCRAVRGGGTAATTGTPTRLDVLAPTGPRRGSRSRTTATRQPSASPTSTPPDRQPIAVRFVAAVPSAAGAMTEPGRGLAVLERGPLGTQADQLVAQRVGDLLLEQPLSASLLGLRRPPWRPGGPRPRPGARLDRSIRASLTSSKRWVRLSRYAVGHRVRHLLGHRRGRPRCSVISRICVFGGHRDLEPALEHRHRHGRDLRGDHAEHLVRPDDLGLGLEAGQLVLTHRGGRRERTGCPTDGLTSTSALLEV